jgi:hypothetical protein
VVEGVTGLCSSPPAAWIVVVLNVLAVANIPRAIYLGRPGYAFVSSSCTMAALTFPYGARTGSAQIRLHPNGSN